MFITLCRPSGPESLGQGLQSAVTAPPPRPCQGIAPMWIAAHGTNMVAVPDILRNSAVAGRGWWRWT